MSTEKTYLTVNEVAARWSRDPETLRLWIKRGFMRAERVGPQKRYGKKVKGRLYLSMKEIERIERKLATGLPINA